MSSDWTAVTKSQNIDFDLETTPLQIQTDSMVGSGDLLWVRFNPLNSDIGPGIEIRFHDSPSYHIGFCSLDSTVFTIPSTENTKVWTFRKSATTIQLLCDTKQIFKLNFADSSSQDCKNKWSLDTAYIKFQSTDKASDSFRQRPKGKLFFDNL